MSFWKLKFFFHVKSVIHANIKLKLSKKQAWETREKKNLLGVIGKTVFVLTNKKIWRQAVSKHRKSAKKRLNKTIFEGWHAM